MKAIGKMKLQNFGGFVAKLRFEYYDEDKNIWIQTKGTDNITLGFAKEANPGDYGVPDNSLCRLYAFVLWGSDKISKEMFKYEQNNTKKACYQISGTTLNNSLTYIGVLDSSVKALPQDLDLESVGTIPKISETQLEELKESIENPSFAQSGSYGPFSWNINLDINTSDITKSSASIMISFLSVKIIDTELNAENPKVSVDLSVAGVGIEAELGVDFSKRTIYLKGKLKALMYIKDFNITLLQF